jgi:methionyl-tRNA formyltransferase
MAKVRIVFLGSRPLGKFALERIKSLNDIEIVGSIVKKPPESAWWKEDPYFHAERVIEHADLSNLEFDFGVSVNYWKIIEPELIAKPKFGFVNIHHSYNLSLRGRDMTTHAILGARNNNRWYHGTTYHYTDDGLDTGPIIASESCEITEFDTAWTLHQKTEALARRILEVWLPRSYNARPPVAKPEDAQPLNLRTDKMLKFIKDIYSDPLVTYDTVRAYDFNGFYEPANTIIDGKLTYLTTESKKNGKLLLEIDHSRKIYADEWIKNNLK